MHPEKRVLDDTDKLILQVLQRDGRISMKALGREIALSPVAAADRVARLEEAGVIEGYGARLCRRALGLTMHAFILVDNVPPGRRQEFLDLTQNEPAVVACHYIVSGGKTAMLEIYCESVESLSLLQARLSAIAPTYTYLAV